MRKVCISFLLVLTIGSVFAQKKESRFIFNGGVQRTGLYEEAWFESILCFEGCSPLNQSPGYSYDFNVLYQDYSKKTNLSFLYGLGINQKSWDEIWITSALGLTPIFCLIET